MSINPTSSSIHSNDEIRSIHAPVDNPQAKEAQKAKASDTIHAAATYPNLSTHSSASINIDPPNTPAPLSSQDITALRNTQLAQQATEPVAKMGSAMLKNVVRKVKENLANPSTEVSQGLSTSHSASTNTTMATRSNTTGTPSNSSEVNSDLSDSPWGGTLGSPQMVTLLSLAANIIASATAAEISENEAMFTSMGKVQDGKVTAGMSFNIQQSAQQMIEEGKLEMTEAIVGAVFSLGAAACALGGAIKSSMNANEEMKMYEPEGEISQLNRANDDVDEAESALSAARRGGSQGAFRNEDNAEGEVGENPERELTPQQRAEANERRIQDAERELSTKKTAKRTKEAEVAKKQRSIKSNDEMITTLFGSQGLMSMVNNLANQITKAITTPEIQEAKAQAAIQQTMSQIEQMMEGIFSADMSSLNQTIGDVCKNIIESTAQSQHQILASGN